jgi:hypothetical protein
MAQPWAGGADTLPQKLKKHARQHMSEDESVEFYLLGTNSQGIVALKDRLLVIKPGWEAGAAFGARVTSFYYRDIAGIEVNTGMLMGVLEVNTPAYQGTQEKDYWSLNKDRDPRKLTNCIPIVKRALKHYQPYLDRLRTMINEAKQTHAAPPSADSGDVVSKLEKLASLKESGVLSEQEFEQAKKRVLGQ